MNWCIVVLKDTVVLWEMASNHWPQIVFEYVSVLQSVYTTFNKVQSKNVMHPQIITQSRFLGGGEVQAGSHSSSALLRMYTLLSSPISTLDSSLNITLFQ